MDPRSEENPSVQIALENLFSISSVFFLFTLSYPGSQCQLEAMCEGWPACQQSGPPPAQHRGSPSVQPSVMSLSMVGTSHGADRAHWSPQLSLPDLLLSKWP